jgi:hypothetical protein
MAIDLGIKNFKTDLMLYRKSLYLHSFCKEWKEVR